MKFDRDFEEATLAQSLKDVGHLRTAVRFLEPHHFGTDKHGWIWETIRDNWVKYSERTSPRLMAMKISRKYKDDGERAEVLVLVKKLYAMTVDDPKAILESFAAFVRTVNLQAALEEAAEKLGKEKVDDAYKTLEALNRRANRHVESTRISWIEDFSSRMAEAKHRKEHPEEMKVFPTGIKKLDKIIGGIQIGELGMVMATTGKGKSISLANFGYHAALKGHKVAYFALEMPARQIARRLDSRFTTVLYNKLKEYDLTPEELRQIDARVKKMEERLKGKLEIVSMPLRRCTIDILRGEIEQLVSGGFRPDLLLIDSGDHMRGVGKFESYRLEQADVYWELKNLAEEDKYGIWTSTHAGRDWADKVATAEAAGEAYDKARISDIAISLNTPAKKTRSTRVVVDDDEESETKPEEKAAPRIKGKYMELYLAKYRDGASHITIPLDAEFDRMFIGEIEDAAEAEE